MTAKEHSCEICHEAIVPTGNNWTHTHGDEYCGTGDGATAYPSAKERSIPR